MEGWDCRGVSWHPARPAAVDVEGRAAAEGHAPPLVPARRPPGPGVRPPPPAGPGPLRRARLPALAGHARRVGQGGLSRPAALVHAGPGLTQGSTCAIMIA